MAERFDKELESTSPADDHDYPVMPLRNTVLFPQQVIPIYIGREKSLKLIEDLGPGDKHIVVVAQEDGSIEDPKPEDLYAYGTLGVVLKVFDMPDNSKSAIVQGIERVKLLSFGDAEPYYTAVVERIKDNPVSDDLELDALAKNLRDTFTELIHVAPNLTEEHSGMLSNIQKPSRLADRAVSLLTVQNEKRQRGNRPYASVYDRVRAGIYPAGHPYGHSVIGSMDDLDAASVDDVHEWFNTFYGASNAILVLSGDIDVETAKEKVTHYFSGAHSGIPLVKPQQWIPEIRENRKEMMYDRVGQTRISRTWPLPNQLARDTTIMYLVNETLISNKNAPLQKRLVDELQLATDVSGGAYGRIVSGEYNLTINLKPGVDPGQVTPVLDEVLKQYLEAGPDPDILQNAKLSVNMYMLGSMESKSTVGRMLAEGQLYAGDPLQIKNEITLLHLVVACGSSGVPSQGLL